MTAARVDLTVGSQKQHTFSAGRQLLLSCSMGNDRACCLVHWSPNTSISWGSVVPFPVLRQDNRLQGRMLLV